MAKKKKKVFDMSGQEGGTDPRFEAKMPDEPPERSEWGTWLQRPREPMPLEMRREALPDMYTLENSTEKHTEEDIGKYYVVEESLQQAVPEFLRKSLQEELERCQSCLRIRRPAWEVVQAMKTIERSETDKETWKGQVIALTGQVGSGKTASLHYIAQHARRNGWLLLHTHGDEFLHETLGFLQPSPHDEAVFDQSRYFSFYLKKLLEENGEQLNKIKLKQTHYANRYRWALDESKGTFEMEELAKIDAPPGETLKDLCEYAVKNSTQVSNLLEDFIREIYMCTEVPVLVLIDDRNKWDMVSSFRDPRKDGRVPLKGENLGLVDAFTNFTVQAPANGLCVWASCAQRHVLSRKIPIHLETAHHRYMLEPYTDSELWSAVTHYTLSDFCKRPVPYADVNNDYVAQVKGFTSSLPGNIRNFLSLF